MYIVNSKIIKHMNKKFVVNVASAKEFPVWRALRILQNAYSQIILSKHMFISSTIEHKNLKNWYVTAFV